MNWASCVTLPSDSLCTGVKYMIPIPFLVAAAIYDRLTDP
jgi:hypothetical protein